MNLLITIEEQHQNSNPFVRILANALRIKGVNVVCSVSEFWDNWLSYDIIHIQWPQFLLKKDSNTIDSLEKLLLKIKNAGKPIVVTCHNLHPHYSTNSLLLDAYNVIFKNATAFIHLGKYSYELFNNKYPSACNVMILHHIYDVLYDINSMPSREEALRILKLSPNYHYILCMGAFRDEAEREIAQLASDYMKDSDYKVLAPGFTKFKWNWKHLFFSFKSYLKYRLIKSKYPEIICNGQFVSDEMLPYYYVVSDIAFIQRKEILNSGNVPMAFYMGKVVVGPDTGNVGPWLKELDNPTFSVNDLSSIKTALLEASTLINNGVGENNQKYAERELASSVIADKHIDLYNNLLNII